MIPRFRPIYDSARLGTNCDIFYCNAETCVFVMSRERRRERGGHTRVPASTLGNDMIGQTLVARSGFSEIARVLLTQIPSRGAEWMHMNKSFMLRLSDFCALDAKLAIKFQSVADALLTANREDFFTTGLHLLDPHAKIDSDVKRSLTAWCKAKSESNPLVEMATEICSRPEH